MRLSTISKNYINIFMDVASVPARGIDTSTNIKDERVEGCILGNLIECELIIKTGMVPDGIRGEDVEDRGVQHQWEVIDLCKEGRNGRKEGCGSLQR